MLPRCRAMEGGIALPIIVASNFVAPPKQRVPSNNSEPETLNALFPRKPAPSHGLGSHPDAEQEQFREVREYHRATARVPFANSKIFYHSSFPNARGGFRPRVFPTSRDEPQLPGNSWRIGIEEPRGWARIDVIHVNVNVALVPDSACVLRALGVGEHERVTQRLEVVPVAPARYANSESRTGFAQLADISISTSYPWLKNFH